MISDERIIVSIDSGFGEIMLTTRRIRSVTKINNSTHVKSIMLEELSYCESNYKENLWYVFFAIIFLAGSLYSGYQIHNMFYWGSVISVIFFFVYFSTRGGLLLFASSGGKIEAKNIHKSIDYIVSFVDKVEAAKNARYFSK